LVNELVEAADERQLSRVVARYGRLDLLLLDELGYVQVDPRGAELLFQITTEREERASIGIGTYLPFSEWGSVFPDPRLIAAIVDRVTSTPTSSKPAPSPTGCAPANQHETQAGQLDADGLRRSVRTIIVHIRRREDSMRVTRIMANLRVADVEAAKSFYTDYLGLSTEEFNMGWVARYTSPDTRANVQLVTHDAAAPETPVISVHTDDVDGAYAEAQKLGYEIVHPIATEPWGVRRFFVRAPDGNVINIVLHRD
jgi:predicted enzyme related to lactoylglutathione lyase